MYLQILKWFFANRSLYLFRGLYLGAFAARTCAQPYRGT